MPLRLVCARFCDGLGCRKACMCKVCDGFRVSLVCAVMLGSLIQRLDGFISVLSKIDLWEA